MINTNFIPIVEESSKNSAGFSMNSENTYENSSRRGLKLDLVNTPNDTLYGRPTDVLNGSSSEKENKLYQFWPGKNSFLLKGFLMTGPLEDCGPCTYNWGCLIGISIVYAILVVPRLVHGVLIVIPIININMFMLTLFFLFLTSFTDPGIIPRKDIFEIDGSVPYPYSYAPQGQISDEEANGTISEASMLRLQADKQEFEKVFNLCYTCHIYRPIRAAHCS